MTESQTRSVESVFLLNRPRGLTLSKRILQTVGLLKPEVVPPPTYIPYGEIGDVADEDLRDILIDQRDSSIEDRSTTLVPIVFYPDGALSHVVRIRRATRRAQLP